uniref:RNase H type-1 domain-containing protein n=1 Tax=Hordeum vulgare subsp. vulgare TaxID=112509 RepID=A0A8I6X4B7_HORVV
MEGLSFAIQWSDRPIEMEMDSSTTVAMISCGQVDWSLYAGLVSEIKHLMTLRRTCITLIPRSQNKARDKLASFARIEGRTFTWVGFGPDDVLEIVQEDCKNLILE